MLTRRADVHEVPTMNIAVYTAGMRQVGLRRTVVADIPIACDWSSSFIVPLKHPPFVLPLIVFAH